MAWVSLLAVTIQLIGGGQRDALAAPEGVKAIVYIFTTSDCPISNRYAPEVQRLQKRFAEQGVAFRLVYLNRAETDDAIRAHMAEFGYAAIEAVRDARFELVKFTGATITPEAAVIARGRLVYRGRIDDRYAEIGVERPSAATHDLADALDAVLAGKPVRRATAPAVGCYIADLAR
jgi:hypothetical protein